MIQPSDLVAPTCPQCPCPGVCPGWTAFCGWAAEDPPDDVKIRHICARSALRHSEGEERGEGAGVGAGGPPIPPPRRAPDVAEALGLVRAMRACPFRSTDAGCGCAGGRCALRRAAVSHVDCLDCLRRYPDR